MVVKIRGWIDPESIKSPRIAFIVDDADSRQKFILFMLFGDEQAVMEMFSLTPEELQEAKNKVFDPSELVKLGRHYVIRYLISEGEQDLLAMYKLGPEYCKKNWGLVDMLTADDEAIIVKRMTQSAMLKGLTEPDLGKQLQAIKVLSKEVKQPEKRELVDQIADLFKDIEL